MENNKDKQKKSPGVYFKGAAMLSAPTILISYPLVGFGLGWLLVNKWHWPTWTMLVTLMMGLIQGMREVYKLGMRIEKEDKK